MLNNEDIPDGDILRRYMTYPVIVSRLMDYLTDYAGDLEIISVSARDEDGLHDRLRFQDITKFSTEVYEIFSDLQFPKQNVKNVRKCAPGTL